MAIKRNQVQRVSNVQTTTQVSYRLTGSGSTPRIRKPTDPVQVLGVQPKLLYRDLLKTVLTTLIILTALGVIKLTGWLS